jgi:ssDNA thymidine ADP-ribosyltransferase, DarT
MAGSVVGMCRTSCLLAQNGRVSVPARPQIYHITHVDNLSRIVADDELRSDAILVAAGGPAITIGMNAIKLRRLRELRVTCHPDTFVGEYVPFYLCPRSIMLYLLHMGNHEELTYRGGQGPIIHLEADLRQAVAWADAQPRPWAIALSNAGAYYTEFRSSLDNLSDIDWAAVAARDWRAREVKEAKQAEFLMHETFPWQLVASIGVHSQAVAHQLAGILAGSAHVPPVVVRPDWYY